MDHNEIIKDERSLNLMNILYGSYVKMELLEKLVYETYGNSSIADATELNIFIDINSIIHSLYSEKNRIVYNNITDLSSGLINLCAHYRSFFRYKLGVETRFYLINSLNTCQLNKKFVFDYNCEFENKARITSTKKLIDNNLSLLKILCPYLPGIYYIDSVDNYESSVIMAHIIETINSKCPNLIISRDLYPLQLTALYPYTSYLFPKKNRTGDVSWMLPINEKQGYRELFWSNYISALTQKFSIKLVQDLSPINFPLFLALYKFPQRSMKMINTSFSASIARKIILSLVGTEDIKVQYSQILNSEFLINSFPVQIIESRYKALDVPFALQYYKTSPDAIYNFTDLQDNETVNNICARYYSTNPLRLDLL